MNVVNWLSVFILSLLAIGALGYGTNRLTQRNNSLWKMGSLAFAGLICATMFATLSAYSSVVTSAVQAAAAQPLTCVGTPPLVRAGDEIAITGVAPANSEISLVYGEKTLATTTADAAGAFAATITLSVPGLQNVSCQVTADGQSNTIALSFLVIGQAAAPEPPPTNTPEPTATNTTEPTATETPAPAVAPPVVDTTTIPDQLLPGDTFRLRGTADGGARVRVTVNSRVVAGAIAGPQGNWRTTVGFARSGEYTLTAQLVQDDVVVAESEPIFLTVLEPTPTPEPTATNTPEPTATNTSEPTATDTPEPTTTNTSEPTATETPAPTAAPPVVDTTTIPDQLLPGDTFRLRGTADGGARVRVTVNSRVVAGAVAGPQGNWRTTVGFARSGEYTLTAQLVQDDVVVAESEPIFLTVLEPTPTPEPTATDTPEPTATDTPEPTATNTPEPTATDTPEPTATNTPEPTATDTPEPTATNTPEPTATNTPEPTATNTPEPTATNTPTPAAPVVDTESIPDQLLPGDTFRLRGTADGGARVRVAVNDRVVAGAVAGPQGSWRTTVGFARSGEYTLTVQLVQDDAVVAESEPIFLTVLEPTPTPEPTATNTPEPTATNTPEPTATNTPEPTATDTPEPTATNTPEPTATNTPEPTATNTPEPTATNTPEPTATNTPEPTATNTPEPTATNTPEPTATNTPEPTATNTPEPVAPVVDTASVPDQLLPGDTFRLRGTADSGARVRVAVNNRVVAGAVAGPQGNWRTTVGFAAAGEYTVTVQLVQEDVVVAESEPIFLTVLAPTPTPEPTPTATSAPVDASQPVTDTGAAPVDASQAVTDTGAAPVDASQPVTGTVDAPGALPGTGGDFSGGVPWVVLILVLGALVTLGMGRLANKPTA